MKNWDGATSENRLCNERGQIAWRARGDCVTNEERLRDEQERIVWWAKGTCSWRFLVLFCFSPVLIGWRPSDSFCKMMRPSILHTLEEIRKYFTISCLNQSELKVNTCDQWEARENMYPAASAGKNWTMARAAKHVTDKKRGKIYNDGKRGKIWNDRKRGITISGGCVKTCKPWQASHFSFYLHLIGREHHRCNWLEHSVRVSTYKGTPLLDIMYRIRINCTVV